MSVKDHFLSKKNLQFLHGKMCNKLNLGDNEQISACEELLKNQMRAIYNQNKDNFHIVISYMLTV